LKLGYLALALLGYSANATDLTRTQWPTADAAAVYGLHTAAMMSTDYEYGGIIVQNKHTDVITVTRPETDHKPATVSIRLHPINLREDYITIGMYHTHPCIDGYDHRHFSINDAAEAIYSQMSSYLLDMCTGTVYVFNPDIDMPDDAGVGLTNGRLIGYVALTITKR